MTHDDPRPQRLAAACVVLSLAAALALVLLGQTNFSMSAFGLGWLMLGGAGVWLLSLIRLHQLRLVEQERRELAELERQRRERLAGAGSVFDQDDADQMDALAAGRRLRTIEKWVTPVFAMIVAGFLILFGLRLLPDAWPFALAAKAAEEGVQHASTMAFLAGAIAFVTFAVSRYAAGIARASNSADKTTLRAGAAYFFGTSLLALATAIALVLAHNDYEWFEGRLAAVIGVVMIVLAVEIIINFILDFYRPRVAGQAQHVFYESRVLGVFSEPHGLVRNVAQTIDYQFGFKVSQTWFYQLLGRWIAFLLLFQAAVIYAVTCLVVVPEGQEAVVEVTRPGTSYRWVAEPGIHWSWPWPFASATLIPVQRVQRMELGYDPTKEKPEDLATMPKWKRQMKEVVLWTQKHKVKEYKLLVADRQASADTKVPVNLLSVTMPVHWRVRPGKALEFYKQSDHIEKIIESLAYRELTKYAAHADLLELIGAGGIRAADEIREALQTSCDSAGIDRGSLGVEIVYVGLGGVHPPTEVAEAYENVVNAFEQRDTKIKQAMADAGKKKIGAGGENYQELYDAMMAEAAIKEGDSRRAEASRHVESLLRLKSGGDARESVTDAQDYLYQRIVLQAGEVELFRAQRAAFEAAPRTFVVRAYLDAISEGFKGIHKYVIAVTHPERIVYQGDLKEQAPLQLLNDQLRASQEAGGR